MSRRKAMQARHRQAQRDPHTSLTPPGYRHPDRYTERELHERLVLDACTGVATPLAWFVAAVTRIGTLNGRGPEAAYQAVRQETMVVTGGLGMPDAPGAA